MLPPTLAWQRATMGSWPADTEAAPRPRFQGDGRIVLPDSHADLPDGSLVDEFGAPITWMGEMVPSYRVLQNRGRVIAEQSMGGRDVWQLYEMPSGSRFRVLKEGSVPGVSAGQVLPESWDAVAAAADRAVDVRVTADEIAAFASTRATIDVVADVVDRAQAAELLRGMQGQVRRDESRRRWRDRYIKEAEEQMVKQRALQLLGESLSEEQRWQWQNRNYFDVVAPSGNRYRILPRSQMGVYAIDEAGMPIVRLCVVPKDHREGTWPIGDVLLMQAIMLQTDEEAFLSMANTFDVPPDPRGMWDNIQIEG